MILLNQQCSFKKILLAINYYGITILLPLVLKNETINKKQLKTFCMVKKIKFVSLALLDLVKTVYSLNFFMYSKMSNFDQ